MTPEISENTITPGKTETVVVTVVKNDRLNAIMAIVVFSFLGVLIRLGLSFLGNSQTPLAAGFWPNFLGCLIMGFLIEQKLVIQTQ